MAVLEVGSESCCVKDSSEGRVYYEDKIETLKSIFGVEDITVEADHLVVGSQRFPIVDDVIILSEPSRYTSLVKKKLGLGARGESDSCHDFAEDVQYSFGDEWNVYSEVLAEHRQEFAQYFDLIDINTFRHARVCDLGCGIGRWSYFLKDYCHEIVLVDFSDAIFVARRNLLASSNSLFFMCDLQRLPFRDDFCEFIFCLGVLHHLRVSCLEAIRRLRRFAPRLLVFLYYDFGTQPFYFRWLLGPVTFARKYLSRIRSQAFRKFFARLGALFLYLPLIYLGWVLRPLGLSRYVPLHEFYCGKSLRRIEQDVYDRFFTSIEQRVSRDQILELRDSFAQVTVSARIPYWHFLCAR